MAAALLMCLALHIDGFGEFGGSSNNSLRYLVLNPQLVTYRIHTFSYYHANANCQIYIN